MKFFSDQPGGTWPTRFCRAAKQNSKPASCIYLTFLMMPCFVFCASTDRPSGVREPGDPDSGESVQLDQQAQVVPQEQLIKAHKTLNDRDNLKKLLALPPKPTRTQLREAGMAEKNILHAVQTLVGLAPESPETHASLFILLDKIDSARELSSSTIQKQLLQDVSHKIIQEIEIGPALIGMLHSFVTAGEADIFKLMPVVHIISENLPAEKLTDEHVIALFKTSQRLMDFVQPDSASTRKENNKIAATLEPLIAQLFKAPASAKHLTAEQQQSLRQAKVWIALHELRPKDSTNPLADISAEDIASFDRDSEKLMTYLDKSRLMHLMSMGLNGHKPVENAEIILKTFEVVKNVNDRSPERAEKIRTNLLKLFKAENIAALIEIAGASAGGRGQVAPLNFSGTATSTSDRTFDILYTLMRASDFFTFPGTIQKMLREALIGQAQAKNIEYFLLAMLDRLPKEELPARARLLNIFFVALADPLNASNRLADFSATTLTRLYTETQNALEKKIAGGAEAAFALLSLADTSLKSTANKSSRVQGLPERQIALGGKQIALLKTIGEHKKLADLTPNERKVITRALITLFGQKFTNGRPGSLKAKLQDTHQAFFNKGLENLKQSIPTTWKAFEKSYADFFEWFLVLFTAPGINAPQAKANAGKIKDFLVILEERLKNYSDVDSKKRQEYIKKCAEHQKLLNF